MKLKHGTRYKIIGSLTAAAVVGLSGGFVAIASAAPAAQPPATQTYRAVIRPLNNSGVYGHARLTLSGNQLTVSVHAHGLVASMPHAEHIHGLLNGGDAACPTVAQDSNHDGYVSLLEGAGTYGPIKVNLTKPQTPFGPNNTEVNGVKVFAPFAGMPNNADFPSANAGGSENFTQTYTFDPNNSYAVDALRSIMPLTSQEIVLHGAMAPQNIDTAGGSSNSVYDPLLPVACADITATANQGAGNGAGQGNTGGSLGNTGPGSTNTITTSTSSNSTITNNTRVRINNQNSQSAHSGNASSSGGNTASASTGSAGNTSATNESITVDNHR